MILLLRGVPGSGKSTVGAAVAERLGAVVLNKDTVRAAMFPGATTEYTTGQDDFVVGLMLAAARWHLERGRMVVLDGRTHARRAQVEIVERFAAETGTRLLVLECVCGKETARRRIEADLAAGTHPAKNRDGRLLEEQWEKWEAYEGERLRVDTERDLGECVEEAVAWVNARR